MLSSNTNETITGDQENLWSDENEEEKVVVLTSSICNYSIWLTGITSPRTNLTAEANLIKKTNQFFYKILIPLVVLVFGLPGDVLNLIALRSPNLQSIPFMYIRGIAVFDLIGLLSVMTFTSRFLIGGLSNYWLALFRARVELTILNSAFTASLYTAVILTLESQNTIKRFEVPLVFRYLLVCHPLRRLPGHSGNLRWNAVRNIAIAFFLGTCLHLPMAFQWVPAPVVVNGKLIGWTPRSNEFLYCDQLHRPFPAIYRWYKQCREWVRLASVLTILIVNIIITRTMQKAKQRRRGMTLKRKKSSSRSGAGGGNGGSGDKGKSSKSSGFAERKLTAMMTGITVIYFLGNGPQALVMIMNDDSVRASYSFQLFRGLGNFMEVFNHCLNFYVFCITSKDYSVSFLNSCGCVRALIDRFCCCSQIGTRKLSVETDASTISIFPDDISPVAGPSNVVKQDETSYLLKNVPKSDLVYL